MATVWHTERERRPEPRLHGQLAFVPFLMGIMEVGATPRRPSSSSTAAAAHAVPQNGLPLVAGSWRQFGTPSARGGLGRGCMAQIVFAPFLVGIMEVGAAPRRPSSSSTAAGAHSVAFRAPSGLQCSKVAERPRGTWPCNEFHWSLHNFNRPQKTSQGMDDEPRVRRQRTGLLVGCATRPMSELHWYPHGRLRKLKNRLKTSRSAREPHRAATSLAMAQAAPALGELSSAGVQLAPPPRPPSRYFGEPMVDMFRPWVRSTVAALKGTCVQPSALQPMGSRSLFSTAKATKMIMVVVVLEGFCSFLTTPRQRPRARSPRRDPRPPPPRALAPPAVPGPSVAALDRRWCGRPRWHRRSQPRLRSRLLAPPTRALSPRSSQQQPCHRRGPTAWLPPRCSP